jgi:hypothetical protein
VEWLEIEKVNPFVVATGLVTVGTTESGRSVTTEVASDNADTDPTPLVATTDTLMYLPMSESVNTYVLLVADPIFEYVPLEVDARCH